jgi:hypothetical protein
MSAHLSQQLLQSMGFSSSAAAQAMQDPNLLRQFIERSPNGRSGFNPPENDMMETLQIARKTFDREKALGPGQPPVWNRYSLCQTVEHARRDPETLIRSTYVGIEKHCSTTHLDDLQLSKFRWLLFTTHT